jgi:hypothetical protein
MIREQSQRKERWQLPAATTTDLNPIDSKKKGEPTNGQKSGYADTTRMQQP